MSDTQPARASGGPVTGPSTLLAGDQGGPDQIHPTRVTIGSDHSADTIKMLRETLCVAQSAVNRTHDPRKGEHVARLQRLIDDCDRQRSLGPDGKHDDRHTPTCGCEDGPHA